MRTHLLTIALVFAVALAAAGGGYALGTQTGGTAAARAGDARAAHARPALRARFAARARLGGLARRLGVPPARLRSALQAVRAERLAARRRQLAGELAQKLGLSESKVESALPAFRPGGGLGPRRGCRRGP